MTRKSGLKFAMLSALGAMMLAAASVGMGGVADAATSACPSPVFANNVVTNSGCQFTTDGIHDIGADPALIVNSAGFFGGGWTLFSLNGGGPGFVSSTVSSGIWDIGANFFTLFGEALLTFTDGSSNVTPDGIVGYLITAANGTSGTWTSPFTNDAGQLKNISNIHVYSRGEPANPPGAVPLPGAVWLLLTALGSLGFFGWWRRRTSLA